MNPFNNKVTKNARNNQPVKTRQSFLVPNLILLLLLVFSLGFNQFIMAKTMRAMGVKKSAFAQVIDKALKPAKSNTGQTQLGGDLMGDTMKLVISQGVPEVYGSEIGVSFDNVQASIDIMRQYDPSYGKKKITLVGDNLQRYINVGLKISCEYCCSAKSIIRPDGQAACGCAHSKAMRGLLAYLIQNHGDQYTNDELLRELARWKGMYFPKQMIKKLASQLQGAQFTPDTAALIMGIDLPDYGQGSDSAPLPSDIKNLPSMVGGC